MSRKISPQKGKAKERLDTMPEPLRAIECYNKRDYSGIRSAIFPAESVRYNVKIGRANYDDGLD